jgi:hypothetical protein
VRATDPRTGTATVYTSGSLPPTMPPGVETGSVANPLVMACINCHNKPAHFLAPPVSTVDDALAAARIDSSLPFVRREAVAVLSQRFPSTQAAREGIATHMRDFYTQQYPQVAGSRKPAIDRAIREIQAIFDRSMFPVMNARWDTYPNQQTHVNDRGCFRCHDGSHKSADGKTIRNDCNSCHVILRQGPAGKLMVASTPEGLPFQHPAADIGDAWKATLCSDCHNGGSQGG